LIIKKFFDALGETILNLYGQYINGTQYVFPRNPIKQEWMIENIINL